VADANELTPAALPHAIHIPIAEIPRRAQALDPEKPLVVMCHTGVRSKLVAKFLLDAGFKQALNLTWGNDAESRDFYFQLLRF